MIGLLVGLASALTLLAGTEQRVLRTFGGSGNDSPAAVAFDANGNAYIAGSTTSLDLPVNGFGRRALGYRFLRSDGVTRKPLVTPGATQLTCIASHPRFRNVTYVAIQGPAGVSLARSDDFGESWKIQPGVIPGETCASLAVDAHDAGTVYLATAFRQDSGLYRSADRGSTWKLLTRDLNLTPPTTFRPGSRILSHPHAPGALTLVLHRTIPINVYFRVCMFSNDSGATWSTISSCSDIAPDPHQPKGLFYLDDSGAKLYRSYDLGETWIEAATGLTIEGWAKLLPDPVWPDVLYIAASDALYRSDDGGAHWSKRPLPSGLYWLDVDPNSAFLYGVFSPGPEPPALYRSTDGGLAWIRLGETPRDSVPWEGWQFLPDPANPAGPSNLVWLTPGADGGFVAKLDSEGRLVWSSYLDRAGSPSAIAAGADGSVYIAGLAAAGTFVSKIAPDGLRAVYALGVDLAFRPTSIAVDSAGAAYIAGTTGDPCAAWCGVAIRVDPAGTSFQQIWSTSDLGFQPPRLALDRDQNLLIGSNNPTSPLVRLGRDGTTVPLLRSGSVDDIAVDAGGNIHVTGMSRRDTVATAGAFERRWMSGYVAKLAHGGTTVFQAFFGGIDQTQGRFGFRFAYGKIALDAQGNIYIRGESAAVGHPTRNVTRGPAGPYSPHFTVISPDGSRLLKSTFMPNDLAAGWTAFRPLGGGAVRTIGVAANGNHYDVAVGAVELAPEGPVRIDAVLDTAAKTWLPLAANRRMSITGSGFGADAEVLFDRRPGTVLTRASGHIRVDPPDALAPDAVRTVIVVSGGVESNSVLLYPYFVSSRLPYGVYTADDSGSGQALALNEDGTLNSRENPAKPGSSLTFAFNGADGAWVNLFQSYVLADPTSSRFQTIVSRYETSKGEFPGLPGEVLRVKIALPRAEALWRRDLDVAFPFIVQRVLIHVER